MRRYGRKILSIAIAVGIAVSVPGINVSAGEYVNSVFESETEATDVVITTENVTEEITEATTEKVTEETTEETIEETTEETIEEITEETTENVFEEDEEEAEAEQATVIYDASTMTTFNRTLQDVVSEYEKVVLNTGSYVDGNSSTYYVNTPSTTSPYAQGSLTTDTLKVMHDMTNFYRWIVGVEPLDADCINNDGLQKGALVRNYQFAHSVDASNKPDDMSDELWNEGAAVSHNILSMGTSPFYSIGNWMNEGYSLSSNSWGTLGHRAILIAAKGSDIQYGYVNGIAIGVRNASQNTMPEAFAAFPCPGYMPDNLISRPQSSAWSFEYNRNILSYSADALSVQVTNTNTGVSYTCTKENGKLYIENYLYGDVIGFAQPTDYTNGKYTDTYDIEITGLTDKATGNPASIVYSVIFTDITKMASTKVKEVKTPCSRYVIYNTFATTDNLKKVAAILPQEVMVIGDSGRKEAAMTKGPWILDEENQCFTNEIDKNTVSDSMVDANNVIGEISIPYVISEDYYDSYNSLSISPSSANEGDTVKFSVYRTRTNCDLTRVYKLSKSSDNNYSAEIWLDSQTSPEFDAEASEASTYSAYHIYNKAVTESDSGDYISIYYQKSYMYTSSCPAYVSTSVKSLAVSHIHNYSSTYTVDKEATCEEAGSKSRHCAKCDAKTDVTEIKALGHDIETETVQELTCTQDGIKIETCTRCDYYKQITTPATGHDLEKTVIQEKTCTLPEKYYEHCKNCDYESEIKTSPKLGHAYDNDTVFPATTTEDGKILTTCSRCGKESVKKIIYKASSISLAATKYNYTGSAIRPKVTVKDSRGITISTDNYKVSYSNNIKVGKATVTITFKGNYTGKVTKAFSINPRGTSIKSLTPRSNAIRVEWYKQETQVTHYYIMYSTNEDFSNAKVISVPIGKVGGTIQNLKSGQTYYFKIRTERRYVSSSGNVVKYTSKWSAVKSAKAK